MKMALFHVAGVPDAVAMSVPWPRIAKPQVADMGHQERMVGQLA